MNRSTPCSHTTGYAGLREPSPQPETSKTNRSILWIDGVGGYLMLDRDDVLVGQAGSLVDVSIVADISRQAAVIRRRQADYFVEPLQEMCVDGNSTSSTQLLPSNSLLQLGNRVKLRIIKPHPLSSSARLEMASLHRFQPRVDGVLLLADSCILGPHTSCHVRCGEWSQDLLMFRQSGQWYFRTMNEVEVNGSTQQGQILISSGLRLRGSDFSLSVE